MTTYVILSGCGESSLVSPTEHWLPAYTRLNSSDSYSLTSAVSGFAFTRKHSAHSVKCFPKRWCPRSTQIAVKSPQQSCYRVSLSPPQTYRFASHMFLLNCSVHALSSSEELLRWPEEVIWEKWRKPWCSDSDSKWFLGSGGIWKSMCPHPTVLYTSWKTGPVGRRGGSVGKDKGSCPERWSSDESSTLRSRRGATNTPDRHKVGGFWDFITSSCY